MFPMPTLHMFTGVWKCFEFPHLLSSVLIPLLAQWLSTTTWCPHREDVCTRCFMLRPVSYNQTSTWRRFYSSVVMAAHHHPPLTGRKYNRGIKTNHISETRHYVTVRAWNEWKFEGTDLSHVLQGDLWPPRIFLCWWNHWLSMHCFSVLWCLTDWNMAFGRSLGMSV